MFKEIKCLCIIFLVAATIMRWLRVWTYAVETKCQALTSGVKTCMCSLSYGQYSLAVIVELPAAEHVLTVSFYNASNTHVKKTPPRLSSLEYHK